MTVTAPSTDDLWPDDDELITTLLIEPPALPFEDFSEERLYQENDFSLKMVLQEPWAMDPF